MPEDYDIAVVGCGISGMALARSYLDSGQSVVVVDDYSNPGGNHISHNFDGLEFDIGAIIFHTPDLQFETFPELADHVVPCHVVHQKLNAGGTIAKFPFDVWQDLPGLKLGLVPVSILEAWARRAFWGSGENVDAWIRSRIGSALYAQSGLARYIERLSGLQPSDLDPDFAESRLGWIERRSRISTQIRRILGRDPSNVMWQKSVVRAPGGFAAYYAPVVERLRTDGANVTLDAGLTAFRTRADGVRQISGRFGDVSAKRLISTLPFARSAELADIAVPEMDQVTLLSLYMESDAPLRAHGSIVYNFDHRGTWKRLTVHSHFYNASSGRTGFTVEVPLPSSAGPISANDHFSAFAEHARTSGLAASPLRLLGSTTLPFAYAILKKGYRVLKDQTMQRLEHAGIEGAGRHGAFRYLPSSTTAVRAAQDFAKGP